MNVKCVDLCVIFPNLLMLILFYARTKNAFISLSHSHISVLGKILQTMPRIGMMTS